MHNCKRGEWDDEDRGLLGKLITFYAYGWHSAGSQLLDLGDELLQGLLLGLLPLLGAQLQHGQALWAGPPVDAEVRVLVEHVLHLRADLDLLLLGLLPLGDAPPLHLGLGPAEVLGVQRVHHGEEEGSAGHGGFVWQVVHVDGVVLHLLGYGLHGDVLPILDRDWHDLGQRQRLLLAPEQLAHELQAAAVFRREVQLGWNRARG